MASPLVSPADFNFSDIQTKAYEPLFNTTKNVGVGPGLTMDVKVPSRISKDYTSATKQAYNIGNIAHSTGITNPQSLVNLSHDPMAASMVRSMDLVPKDNSRSVRPDPYKKFEEQGLSSDYRHALGTSAFKDSIIDWAASNLGMNKNSGILNAIGSGVAKGATIFEEGKDALSQLKSYNRQYPGEYKVDGLADYDFVPEKPTLSFGEILAQPKEDFTANWFAADQIPFGTSPVKKMEMIDAYRKYGPQLYMKQLQNKKKQDFQEIVRREEAAAKAKAKADAAAAAAAKYTAPRHHQDVSRNRGDHTAPTFRDIKDEGPGVTASSGMHGGKHYADGGLINFYKYGGFI